MRQHESVQNLNVRIKIFPVSDDGDDMWNVFFGLIHVGFIEQRYGNVYFFFTYSSDISICEGKSLDEIRHNIIEQMQ